MLVSKKHCLRHSKGLKLKILCDDKKILLEGNYGLVFFPLNSPLCYSRRDRKLWLSKLSSKDKNFLNLSFVLMLQAVLSVLVAYRKQLNIVGIGYFAEVQNNNCLVLKLGFSHLVKVQIPDYLKITCPRPRVILLEGLSAQKVNNFASVIRQLKLPSAYKEKGIYISGEPVLIKQGKKT